MKTPGRNVLIEENRDVITNIENEPDRKKAGDTVQVSLKKITQDVAIEQFHIISKLDLRTSYASREQAHFLIHKFRNSAIPNP